MRTVGISSAVLACAFVAAGCLGTRADDQTQDPNFAQNGNGQINNGGGYGVANYSANGAQPGSSTPAPGQFQPQAPQQQSAPAQPGLALPTMPGLPGITPPAAPPPSNGGAKPAPQAAPAPGLPGFALPFPGGAAPGPQQSGGSTGAATPIDPNVATIATVPLLAYAAQEAPGMAREGGVIAGQFREGQTLEQPFQLVPNKCYTVLAVGAGVFETHITIVAVTPIPATSPVLAQDNTSGSNASLGGRGNCYRWQAPIGINAKYVVRAARGTGVVAAQLYSK